MPKKKLTYEAALAKLNKIAEEIENGEIGIEELAEKVKEAKKLFEFCYGKLREIKTDVENIISEDFDTGDEN